MPFNKLPAVDENNAFPAPVRLAMANSAEIKALLDLKNPLTYKGYRPFLNTDDPTKYPLGISNALLGTGDGFNWSNGESFMNVVTFRNATYTGGTTQIAFPYTNDANPPMWRMWENGATAWSAWVALTTTTTLNAALASYTPRWKGSTAYTAGQQVLSPKGELVESKSARTSSATWTTAEAAFWKGIDKSIMLTHSGFAWSGGVTPWDAGPLTVDTTGMNQGTPGEAFCAPGTVSGTVRFLEPGNYDMFWYITPGADPGSTGYRINASSTGTVNWPGPAMDNSSIVMGSGNRMAGQLYWETTVVAVGIRVDNAGQEVRLQGVQQNASTNKALVKVVKRSSI